MDHGIPAWLDIACRYCGAEPGHPCRSRSGRETQPHSARLHDSMPPPVLTEDRLAESRRFAAQFHERTLVTVAFGFSCGCTQAPSEPVPLKEANVYGIARAHICDRHNEFAVVTRVTTRLVADADTIYRVLVAADIQPHDAEYVAGDQNDAARQARLRAGMGGGPS